MDHKHVIAMRITPITPDARVGAEDFLICEEKWSLVENGITLLSFVGKTTSTSTRMKNAYISGCMIC
jgi:hypothetical protein